MVRIIYNEHQVFISKVFKLQSIILMEARYTTAMIDTLSQISSFCFSNDFNKPLECLYM